MPHALLHLSAVRLLERDENAHPLVAESLRRQRPLALLGAVLLDLPWFEKGRGREVEDEGGRGCWGTRLHRGSSMALGLSLVAHHPQDKPLGPLSRLALAAGYFSHAALDTALHPLTRAAARGDRGQDGGDASTWYRRGELAQTWHLHAKLTGLDADEDEELWAAAEVLGRADLDRTLRHVQSAATTCVADPPSGDTWRGWVERLVTWSKQTRGRLKRADGGRVAEEAIRRRYYDAVGFPDRFVAAQARAVAWVNRLGLAFERGDLGAPGQEALRAAFPACSLDGDHEEEVGGRVGDELAAQRGHARAWDTQSHAARLWDSTTVTTPPRVPVRVRKRPPAPRPPDSPPPAAPFTLAALVESVTDPSAELTPLPVLPAPSILVSPPPADRGPEVSSPAPVLNEPTLDDVDVVEMTPNPALASSGDGAPMGAAPAPAEAEGDAPLRPGGRAPR